MPDRDIIYINLALEILEKIKALEERITTMTKSNQNLIKGMKDLISLVTSPDDEGE